MVLADLESVKEFIDFIKIRKAWWLVPIILLLIILGVAIIIMQTSALSPLIYPFI